MTTLRIRWMVSVGAAALLTAFVPALAGTAEAASPPSGCSTGSVCFFEHPYFTGVMENISYSRLNDDQVHLGRTLGIASSFYNGCGTNMGIFRGQYYPKDGYLYKEYICVHGGHRMSDFRVAQFGNEPSFDNRPTDVGGRIGDLFCEKSAQNGGYRTY